MISMECNIGQQTANKPDLDASTSETCGEPFFNESSSIFGLRSEKCFPNETPIFSAVVGFA